MQSFIFHLDFVSPYAFLAFERLPQVVEGVSHATEHRPVLLGAILRHHGHAGPVAIPAKHAWVLRHCAWLARAHGIAFQPPASHPFDPLPLLRLALATSDHGSISRHVAATLFRHAWAGEGGDPNAPEALARLAAGLTLRRDPAGDAVKAQLRANTAAALEAGVFGLPSFQCADGDVLWGLDALPMLRERLLQNPHAG